jgi:hypothetical protein
MEPFWRFCLLTHFWFLGAVIQMSFDQKTEDQEKDKNTKNPQKGIFPESAILMKNDKNQNNVIKLVKSVIYECS